MSNKAKFNNNSETKRHVDNLITGMIFMDLQPISFTEDVGFRNLLKYLEPRYTTPSRRTFADKLLPTSFTKASTKLKLYVQKHANDKYYKYKEQNFTWISSVNLTTDGWTRRDCRRYITYTAHFIRKYFIMNSFVLGTYELPTSHTADNLQHHITKIINIWLLQKPNEVEPTGDQRAELLIEDSSDSRVRR